MTNEHARLVTGGNVTPRPIPALNGRLRQTSHPVSILTGLLMCLACITFLIAGPIGMILAACHIVATWLTGGCLLTLAGSLIIFFTALSVNVWNSQR